MHYTYQFICYCKYWPRKFDITVWTKQPKVIRRAYAAAGAAQRSAVTFYYSNRTYIILYRNCTSIVLVAHRLDEQGLVRIRLLRLSQLDRKRTYNDKCANAGGSEIWTINKIAASAPLSLEVGFCSFSSMCCGTQVSGNTLKVGTATTNNGHPQPPFRG